MKNALKEVTTRRTKRTIKPVTYPDPSNRRDCGPVCCLNFPAPFEVGSLSYGNGRVRTYSPGKVDARCLPLRPVFCDDKVELSKAVCKGRRGYFIVPVALAQDVLGNTLRFAQPDQYPDM